VTGRRTIDILGCEIDALDMDETVARCDALIRAGSHAQHVAINVAKLVALRDDPELADIVRSCAVVNADGQGVVWAGRLLGAPLPERVAGIDLMGRLLALCEERGYGVYVLGAKRDVLERAMGVLRERHPRLRFAGWRDGYFSAAEEGEVRDEIRASDAQLLLVAISSPRKERFLGEHGAALGVPLVMGVGGSIDVVAGVTRRAPVLWQRLGLEWLFRLLQEPRRMWRRYAVTNGRFAWLLAGELVRRAAR
jgi:N-acetylglucosaminyldiphosphoundecaprenol N-acetyl-beta-D-mannosaminyltransferase